MIVSDKWAQTTRSLRSLGREMQPKFKHRQLAFVTFSGIFTLRHNEHLVRHSGLLCFDFDHVGNETSVRDLQQRLIADPILNVNLAFRSPSGDGLKLVVKNNFTPENHNAKYAQLAQYILQNYNITVDHTNDIARACFLCHDPKAYIRQSTVYGQQSTEDGKWYLFVIPRGAFRPWQYTAEGDEQLLVSPATVEVSGLFITPVKEHFERIRKEDVVDILTQCTIK